MTLSTNVEPIYVASFFFCATTVLVYVNFEWWNALVLQWHPYKMISPHTITCINGHVFQYPPKALGIIKNEANIKKWQVSSL